VLASPAGHTDSPACACAHPLPRPQNISLPDIDALPDLVDSVILGLNVTNAFNAISAPFQGAAPGAPRPGQLAAKRGLRAKHPIVIIPGGRLIGEAAPQRGMGQMGAPVPQARSCRSEVPRLPPLGSCARPADPPSHAILLAPLPCPLPIPKAL
jgi:hypothetical protein